MSKPLDGWGEFPRIGFIVDGKKKYYELKEAIPLWDSGWTKVKDTGELLLSDYSTRPMTDEENRDFQARVDRFSDNK